MCHLCAVHCQLAVTAMAASLIVRGQGSSKVICLCCVTAGVRACANPNLAGGLSQRTAYALLHAFTEGYTGLLAANALPQAHCESVLTAGRSQQPLVGRLLPKY